MWVESLAASRVSPSFWWLLFCEAQAAPIKLAFGGGYARLTPDHARSGPTCRPRPQPLPASLETKRRNGRSTQSLDLIGRTVLVHQNPTLTTPSSSVVDANRPGLAAEKVDPQMPRDGKPNTHAQRLHFQDPPSGFRTFRLHSLEATPGQPRGQYSTPRPPDCSWPRTTHPLAVTAGSPPESLHTNM